MERFKDYCCPDIRSLVDEISQQWLIRFLEHRIGETRVLPQPTRGTTEVFA
jgi:hypothetical protein